MCNTKIHIRDVSTHNVLPVDDRAPSVVSPVCKSCVMLGTLCPECLSRYASPPGSAVPPPARSFCDSVMGTVSSTSTTISSARRLHFTSVDKPPIHSSSFHAVPTPQPRSELNFEGAALSRACPTSSSAVPHSELYFDSTALSQACSTSSAVAPHPSTVSSPMSTRKRDPSALLKAYRSKQASSTEKLQKARSDIKMLKASQTHRQDKLLKAKIQRRDDKIIRLQEGSKRKDFRLAMGKLETAKGTVEVLRQRLNLTTRQHALQVRELEQKIVLLEVTGGVDEMEQSSAKDGKCFDLTTRMRVYRLITGNTSTQNIPGILQDLFDTTPANTPSRTTVERMCVELGVISDIFAADYLYQNSGLTIAFDSSTQSGVHFNCIHVTGTDKQSFLLDVEQLPGGTALDYSAHIFMTLKSMADTYLKLHPTVDASSVYDTMVRNINHCMTDRAIVNSATVNILAKTWKKPLTKLFCHIH